MVVPPAAVAVSASVKTTLAPRHWGRKLRRDAKMENASTQMAPPPRLRVKKQGGNNQREGGLRFAKTPPRSAMRKMRWPTSPVQFTSKQQHQHGSWSDAKASMHSLKEFFVGEKTKEECDGNQREPDEDAEEDVHVNVYVNGDVDVEEDGSKTNETASSEDEGEDHTEASDEYETRLLDASVEVPNPSNAIDLRARRVPVQSVGYVSPALSPSSATNDTTTLREVIAFDEQALIRLTLQEELDEFCRDTNDHAVRTFPEYLSSYEKQLVQDLAEKLGLGCDVRESICVFKLEAAHAVLGGHPRKHAALTRVQSMPETASFRTGNDVFVDVPSLAEHGCDGVIARLELRRLDSGGGIRRRMLWDVAQLSPNDRIADRITEGQGGVYAVQSRASGTKLAMFKPADEERFVREGIQPGEGAVREEAAYVLDSRSQGFSGVPATAAARLKLHADRPQNGAVQRFMNGTMGSMESYGMPLSLDAAAAFVPIEQVHRIALLDLRTFNTDRHAGNILLLGDRAPFTMVPIDHGCILPSWFHLSEARFDWLTYPQSRAPLSSQSLAFIAALDADGDAAVLRKLGIREECVTTLRICILFLQLAAKHQRTVHWMGSFLQRGGCFETPSRLELAIAEACHAAGLAFSFVPNELGELKSLLPLNALSRRPPRLFFRHLERLLTQAVSSTS